RREARRRPRRRILAKDGELMAVLCCSVIQPCNHFESLLTFIPRYGRLLIPQAGRAKEMRLVWP
ncbi:unnamed protein product, partial [Musa acuminata var. zebrina]